MKFTVEFKRGPVSVAKVNGFKDIDEDLITIRTIINIMELEQKLEFLTGYRVHITSEETN